VGTTYKEGSLVKLSCYNERRTICGVSDGSYYNLREYPISGVLLQSGLYQLVKGHNSKYKTFDNFEGKYALVVKVLKNRLDQPLGYRVLIGENTWFCKSFVAEKYFNLVEKQGDESR